MTTGITSNRLAVTAGIVAACAVVSCGNAVTSPRSQPSRPITYVTCSVNTAGYMVAIKELDGYPIQINGFTVMFATNRRITGTDTEPGSGYVNGIALTGMNDLLTSGQTLMFNVQPDDGMPDATGCAVLRINESKG
jgi:hypothetical protein